MEHGTFETDTPPVEHPRGGYNPKCSEWWMSPPHTLSKPPILQVRVRFTHPEWTRVGSRVYPQAVWRRGGIFWGTLRTPPPVKIQTLFQLLSLDVIREKMLAGEFKPNCALGKQPFLAYSCPLTERRFSYGRLHDSSRQSHLWQWTTFTGNNQQDAWHSRL